MKTDEQADALKEALRARGYEAEVRPSEHHGGFELSFGEGAAMATHPEGDDPNVWAESVIDFIERTRSTAEEAGLVIALPPKPAARVAN